MFPYRVFTLAQANLAVADVAELTARAQQRLDELRRGYDGGDPEAGRALEAETRALLTAWQEGVLEIGAAPKGIFTVDFRSPDLNVLWCWSVDEPEIAHRHFTWESFKDRVAVGRARIWPSRN